MNAATPAAAPRALLERFFMTHPASVVHALEPTSPPEIAALLSTLGAPLAAPILRRMEAERAARVLFGVAPERRRQLLTELDTLLVTQLVCQLQKDERAVLLDELPPSARAEVSALLAYSPGTAGALMDRRVSTFSRSLRAAAALARLREAGRTRSGELILVDAEGTFAGVLGVEDVVCAEPEQRLEEIAGAHSVYVQPMAARDEVVDVLNQHRVSSLPVVDLQGRVVGVIRYSGLVEALQQDAAADLQSMVGGSSEERALSGVWVGVKGRLPWLCINLLTAFLAASVVGLFEGTIARYTALAVLLPVVAGQSGNTGAQALAVTMRGLALREIGTSHGPRVVLKEIGVGFINGVCIALITSAGVYAWSRSLALTLVMLLAMLGSMVAASVTGAVVPVALVKLGRDPASAASIILTTVTDVTGFLSFLGLAALLAHLLGGL